MVVQTINGAFEIVGSRGEKTAWRWLAPGGEWKNISSAEVYGRVRALAGALAAWGIGKGDRVALIAENRWEWPVTDFAVLALGAVDVPLFPTLTADQIGYLVRDCGARVVVVSTRQIYRKLCDAGELPSVEHVVVMDDGAFDGAENFSSLVANAEAMQSRDAAFDAAVKAVQPEDLATIIYTSGTTGEPKGVMLTHGNIASNISVSVEPFGFGERDSCISFLPLSHVTARHLDYALMCHSSTLAYCPRLEHLPAAMKAVAPTIFVAVPRVYEKVRQSVEGKSTGVKKKILAWALRTGRRHRKVVLEGRRPGSPGWRLAEKLVYGKIAAAFGGKVETFVAGGAPLGLDTGGWFADAGIRILEGYGLTETSPVISLNTPQKNRLGTVGPVLPNVEVRFAADGELEVRGPSVFRGYWNKPEETRQVFTPDGWFCTGDIAKLDGDGFLSITDRKKELLKTSAGKLIAPQAIENKLKAHLLVGNAALVGDKRKFVSAILSPNFSAVEIWAKENGVATTDRAALWKHPKLLAEYRAVIKEVNQTLAPFEQIKRQTVVPEEWSIEGGELTPSMKLKRRVIDARYRNEIGEMYGDEPVA